MAAGRSEVGERTTARSGPGPRDPRAPLPRPGAALGSPAPPLPLPLSRARHRAPAGRPLREAPGDPPLPHPARRGPGSLRRPARPASQEGVGAGGGGRAQRRLSGPRRWWRVGHRPRRLSHPKRKETPSLRMLSVKEARASFLGTETCPIPTVYRRCACPAPLTHRYTAWTWRYSGTLTGRSTCNLRTTNSTTSLSHSS